MPTQSLGVDLPSTYRHQIRFWQLSLVLCFKFEQSAGVSLLVTKTLTRLGFDLKHTTRETGAGYVRTYLVLRMAKYGGIRALSSAAAEVRTGC